MERTVHPTAAITGKHSPGAIAAVCGRRQSHDEHARVRITEASKRLGPVVHALKAARRVLRACFPPAHQPRAFAAADDRLIEFV
jgi:hypothetical protein